MSYTKPARKKPKAKAVVLDEVSSLQASERGDWAHWGFGGGEDGVHERELKRQVGGGKRERERLSEERRRYLIVEAVADAFGIETIQRDLDEVEARKAQGEEDRKLVRVKEGAESKGVPVGTVHHWVGEGRLTVQKYQLHCGPTGGPVFRELIDEGELGELAENRPRPGRPKAFAQLLEEQEGQLKEQD